MGSCMSLKSSSGGATDKNSKIIRVVHLNGRMEEFEDAITVGEVTAAGGNYFVFAQVQLAYLFESKPLDSATQLEKGNIYYLLPHSIFKTEMSPIDFATISKRLTLAAAQNSTARPDHHHNSAGEKKKKKKKKQKQKSGVKRNRYAVPVPVSPRVNNTISDCRTRVAVDNHLFDHVMNHQSQCSWKPILESITERSFTRDDSSHQDTNYR